MSKSIFTAIVIKIIINASFFYSLLLLFSTCSCDKIVYRFNFPTGQVLIYDSRRLYISQLSDLKLCIKLSLKVKSLRD